MTADFASGLLICSLAPEFLERGFSWFSEHAAEAASARTKNPWWRDNTILLEKDLVIKPSELARRLADLGYERTQSVRGRGLFAVRGGLTEVWPVNAEKPYIIEFKGNAIAAIHEREETKEAVKPRVALSQTIDDLPPGSFVVHEDHGIGIYRGRTRTPMQAQTYAYDSEEKAAIFYVVEYAPPAGRTEPDRLFVPFEKKNRLAPYVGLEAPHIHRLGGSVWAAAKRKVKENAEKLARELVALYAARDIRTRPPYHGDPVLEEELRRTFAFEETQDQERAEREIFSDMEGAKPMDRVLAGDVGFGKTEIAIRAAFRAVCSGRQVAILSPTTVLAAQHLATFRKRLEGLSVRTSMLSRLVSPREEKAVLSALADGAADIIIGTHRILSEDIAFKNLGLVIIDEEQRFGVKQKERLKQMRNEVDMLSLSATPIPRTLQFTLAKLRDISLLETPPPERIPIQTLVLPYSAKLVRNAIRQETGRGGQVYFLHNRVETIGMAKRKLDRILAAGSGNARIPKIGIMHGRMSEHEIISRMNAFRAREIDLLLATTIIENGLDISSANTIIVDDATRLGLAEAHQLRGRVGRGREQAFAYFLYKPKHLTEKAAERLEALEEYSALGQGYALALRDLEIRGAGNILGREQSGAAYKVGLNLYYQLLSEAVEEIKNAS